MEDQNVSATAPNFAEFDEDEDGPPSEDEVPIGDPFSVEDMGTEFIFIQPETRHPDRSHSSQSHSVIEPEEYQDHNTRIRDVFKGAGKVIAQRESQYENQTKKSKLENSPYTPFTGALDYNVGKWAKELGPGDNALSKLLAIPGVVEALGLSWRNARELNQIIDHELPNLASWNRMSFTLEGTDHEVECFYQDPLECVQALYGNPAWASDLHIAPERHYTDDSKTNRIYDELNTGNWWWKTQAKLGDGATVVPIIVSTDKTSLKVLSSGSEAYPAYLTIGNIPKATRRKPSMHAQLLFAYLPTEQFTATMLSKDQVRRAKHQAIHHAMKRIFKSLKVAGRDGVEMASGDGKVRRCHLIVAVYVADYPEQCLVTCTRYMHCPICHVEPNDLGKYGESRRRRQRETVQKLDQARDASTRVGANLILKEAGNTDTLEPFVTGLPFTDRNQSITPDILHQLYQGSGISGFSRLSGNEHRQIAKQLLGCIVDFAPSEAIRASRALLDFLYIAQAEAQTDKSLEKLEDALEEFHKHKNIFLETKAREADAFDFPKLHGLLHYAPKIRDFGTTDNYNTENTERLHIDMAKDAYRATNRKEILPQMILWLERKEKLFAFSTSIEWRQGASVTAPCIRKKLEADTYFGYHRITLAKTPSLANMPLTNFVQIYSLELSSFERALASFVRMRQEYLRVPLHPFPSALVISTWFRFKTSNRQPAYLSSKADNFEESIHVSPCRKS
ncbi:hypothetical protein FRB90_000895 [Tulasnella sp. 427]|nr:hypothetical protein FRB90_000895 [Tulasnella sp. 427]